MRCHSPGSSNHGFTLIEIAIVLVIVGLLAGSILAGKNLIEAATIRQQMTQIEKINTAVLTFRGKYGGLPGDLEADDAINVGFVPRSGGSGHGDGNGRIQHCDFNPSSGVVQEELGCEIVLFWSDLSAASLIEGSFTTAADADPVFTSYEESLKYYPPAKLSAYATLIPAFEYDTGKNWLATVHVTNHDASSTGNDPHLFPVETAMVLDTKMDDQNPLAGLVQIRETGVGDVEKGFFTARPAEGPDHCVEGGAYNHDYADDLPPCQIDFLMGY